jgi:hypothetical protein
VANYKLTVFYIGNILVDKSILCNSCNLTGWSVSCSESSCIQTMFKSKKLSNHKLLEDVHEESLKNPRQNSRFLCNRPDAPQCPVDNDEDVRTLEQHRPDARSISIQQVVGFQKSTLFGKFLQAVRTTWQHVQTMSNFSEYARVPSNEERILAKTVWTLGQAVQT